MRMKWSKKISSFILCMMLIVAMAFTTTGCNGSTDQEASKTGEEANAQAEVTVLGEGNTVFYVSVVDKEDAETRFEIHTDKEMVGDALVELDLIAGEEGEYGLYVKTVNGITADYDKDGVYWAFYINDEMASTGVSSTPVTEGENYSFKVE